MNARAVGAWAVADLEVAPITVAWEVTRACALRCLHCRAEAIPRRDPAELSTAEGFTFVDEVVEMGARVLVITGGDPLMRPDVFDLAAYASGQGLHVGLSPSATPRLTRDALARAADVGVSTVHLSLDGADAESHDTFRGVRGSFARTLRAMDNVRNLGMSLQVGTSVTKATVGSLPEVAELLEDRADLWSVFFLVPTGRAAVAQMLDADEHEAVLRWLAGRSQRASYAVRTTAAPAYRRVCAQLGLAPPVAATANDGKGFCFVSHNGQVNPSGFLPLAAGNVRSEGLAEIYRHNPLFRALRDPARLTGKCGRCEFAATCGGSRARAYAFTGDPFAADPGCAHEPGRQA